MKRKSELKSQGLKQAHHTNLKTYADCVIEQFLTVLFQLSHYVSGQRCRSEVKPVTVVYLTKHPTNNFHPTYGSLCGLMVYVSL